MRAERVWWCGLACMLLGLLVPVLAVAVPPLTDYPNHLARAYVLAFGAHDAVLRRMLVARWAIIPNLAMDLIAPPLMHVMPPLVAGRVVVAVAVLLPSTGAIALSVANFRRRSLWQLGVGLVAYDGMLLMGMLNFQMAAGVALWGAACWVWLARRHVGWAALSGVGFGLAAFVCHLFGFGFFALLIFCAELPGVVRHGLRDAAGWRYAVTRGAAVAAAVAVPCVLYVTSRFAGAGGLITWQTLWHKLTMLLVPVMGYSAAGAVLVAVAIGAVLAGAAWRGRLLAAPMATYALRLLAVAYMLLPIGAKGGYWIDTRIPVLLAFCLFALVLPAARDRRGAVAACVLLAVSFTGRMAWITSVWRGAQGDIADVRAVVRAVPAGARVLVVDGNVNRQHSEGATVGRYGVIAHGLGSSYWHFGAFVLLDRRAFPSDTFALAGQQPVVALSPYDRAGDGGANQPMPYTQLAAAAGRVWSGDRRTYLDGWPERFDYVLVLAAAAVPDLAHLLPERLVPLDARGMAALFEVKR